MMVKKGYGPPKKTEHGFGRKPSPPDDRDFRLGQTLAVMRAEGVVPKAWAPGPVNDQGDKPMCVGEGGLSWANSTPVVDNWPASKADELYAACKKIDGDSEDGTTVRNLAKVLKAMGRISAYSFASSVQECEEWISNYGPLILGFSWYAGMEDTDAEGVIRPTGTVQGGHCTMAYAVDERYFRIRNSWGKSWGMSGDCLLSHDDFAQLLGEQGEALAANEMPLPVPTPPKPTPKPTPTPTPDPGSGCCIARLARRLRRKA